MCRILRVLVVAPPERHRELRSRLASLDYDLVLMTPGGEEAVAADVALVWEGDEALVARLRARGMKVVGIGGPPSADLVLAAEALGTFPQRVWDLIRTA